MNDNDENNLVVRDEVSGDVLQDTGSSMSEGQSYERVIDGLKIASEACAHLVASEPENAGYWRALCARFDGVRKAAMHISGLSLSVQFEFTKEARGQTLPWRQARDRLRYGLKQAEGGFRQLGVAHRGDLVYSRMANDLQDMQQKILAASAKRPARIVNDAIRAAADALRDKGLILPPLR